MQSTSSITRRVSFVILYAVFFITTAAAQENSPYSRYGLGDMINTQHVLNRGMGGISVAYADGQIVNLNNPSAFANIRIVTYDLGVTIDARTLRNNTLGAKYNSTNFSPSYLAMGVPLNRKKALGLAFGVKPVSRINYSVGKSERIGTSSNDSLQTLYEGSGGLNELFAGIGKKWSHLSVGVKVGYSFGRKETSTKLAFVNDSVSFYKSNYATTTNFNGAFIGGGFQYEMKIDSVRKIGKGVDEKYYLRLGGSGQLGQKLYATQDTKRETFAYDNSGSPYTVDTVSYVKNIKGRIQVPSTYTVGFLFQKTITDVAEPHYSYDVWSIGAEFTAAKWSDYRFYNQQDAVINSWQVKIGGQWMPNPKDYKNYFNRVNYRAGFNIGKDYINADGKELKNYGVTVGFGLPVRPARYSDQYTTIHTAFEFGKRGSQVNNITENYFRFSLGLSLSDIWFVKRRYD